MSTIHIIAIIISGSSQCSPWLMITFLTSDLVSTACWSSVYLFFNRLQHSHFPCKQHSSVPQQADRRNEAILGAGYATYLGKFSIFGSKTWGDFQGMYSIHSILFSEHNLLQSRFCSRVSLLQRYSIVLYKSYWG